MPDPGPDTQLVEFVRVEPQLLLIDFVRIGPDAFELTIGDSGKLVFSAKAARLLADRIEAELGSALLRTMKPQA